MNFIGPMSIYVYIISHRKLPRTCPVDSKNNQPTSTDHFLRSAHLPTAPFGTAGRSRSTDAWDCPWPCYRGKNPVQLLGFFNLSLTGWYLASIFAVGMSQFQCSSQRGRKITTVFGFLGYKLEVTKVVKALSNN